MSACVYRWGMRGSVVASWIDDSTQRDPKEANLRRISVWVCKFSYLFILFKTGPYVGQTGLDFTV